MRLEMMLGGQRWAKMGWIVTGMELAASQNRAKQSNDSRGGTVGEEGGGAGWLLVMEWLAVLVVELQPAEPTGQQHMVEQPTADVRRRGGRDRVDFYFWCLRNE